MFNKVSLFMNNTGNVNFRHRDPRKRATEGSFDSANNCNECGKKLAQCWSACPIKTPVYQIIELLNKGDEQGAADLLAQHNPIPAITGFVCPGLCCHEGCSLGNKDVAMIETYEIEAGLAKLAEKPIKVGPSTGKRVAVIGTGPMGITAAMKLREQGHEVTMIDGNKYFGGVLADGIPSFRLPKEALMGEYKRLEDADVSFEFNRRISGKEELDRLATEYDAVVMATGANKPNNGSGIKGTDLDGVYSAKQLLSAYNLRSYPIQKEFKSIDIPNIPDGKGKTLVIIGGGNAAVDVARVAKLQGGYDNVVIAYRRKDLPADSWEVNEAVKEGIKIETLLAPEEVLGENGVVTGIKLQKQAVVGIDSGSDKPKIKGTGKYTEIKADHVVFALGSKPDAEVMKNLGFETNGNGNIKIDARTGKAVGTKNIYSGGDASPNIEDNPESRMLVVYAIADGLRVAEGIRRNFDIQKSIEAPIESTQGEGLSTEA